MDGGAWWAAAHGVAKSWTRLSDFTFTFHFHALEKEMASHSSVLAWRIPGTGEPGGLLSLGSHRVGHDWRDLATAAAAEKNMSHLYFYLLSHFSSAVHLPPPSTRTTCAMIKNEYCLIFFVPLKFTHREKPTILRKPSGWWEHWIWWGRGRDEVKDMDCALCHNMEEIPYHMRNGVNKGISQVRECKIIFKKSLRIKKMHI